MFSLRLLGCTRSIRRKGGRPAGRFHGISRSSSDAKLVTHLDFVQLFSRLFSIRPSPNGVADSANIAKVQPSLARREQVDLAEAASAFGHIECAIAHPGVQIEVVSSFNCASSILHQQDARLEFSGTIHYRNVGQ